MIEGLRQKPAQQKAPRHPADLQRIRALEQELQRKDKALAETAALLVLKKKVQEIWGDADANMTRNSAK
jgi:hypothetical protein